MGHTCTSRCWTRLRSRRIGIKFRQGTTFCSGIQSPLSSLRFVVLASLTLPLQSFAQETTGQDVGRSHQSQAWVRGAELSLPNVGLTEDATPLAKYNLNTGAFVLEVVFRPETAYEFGMVLGASSVTPQWVGYNMNDRELFISTDTSRTTVPLELINNRLSMRLHSDGLTLKVSVLREAPTLQIGTAREEPMLAHPRTLIEQKVPLELFAYGGNTNVVTFRYWPLRLED